MGDRLGRADEAVEHFTLAEAIVQQHTPWSQVARASATRFGFGLRLVSFDVDVWIVLAVPSCPSLSVSVAVVASCVVSGVDVASPLCHAVPQITCTFWS